MLLVLLLAFPAAATTRYVATNGNDRNPGTAARPFATIQHAVSTTVAGDVVNIGAGTYREAVTIWDRHGTPSAHIVVQAQPGAVVVIDGSGKTSASRRTAIVSISNSSYIDVRGLELANSAYIGLLIWGSHDIVAERNHVHHCYQAGISGGYERPGVSRNLTITNNTVHDCVLENASRSMPERWAQAVSTTYSGGVVISGNRIRRNYGEGIALIVTERGVVRANELYDNYSVQIYLDNARQSVVDRNYITTTGDRRFHRYGAPAIGIACANERYRVTTPLANLTITNNIVLWPRWGFYFGSYGIGGGLVNVRLANNTFHEPSEEALRIDRGTHRGSIVENNIFHGVAGRPLAKVTGSGISYRTNNWSGGAAGAAESSSDVKGDPKFVNPSGPNGAADFRLQKGSPCIDRGVTVKDVATDYFGRRRIGAYDIGAHEL
jgi:parallel beta-helix repeat protein